MIHRSYRYRFYPTPEQAEQLARTFGCVRYVYNRALAERSRAWSQEQRRVSLAESDKMLTAWKRNPENHWLTEPSSGPLQAALRNLQTAFVAFWRGQSGYPKFKKKGRSKDSAIYFSNCFTFHDGQIKLAKQSAPLNIKWSRPLPNGASPSSVTVTRDAAGRYHVSIKVEERAIQYNTPGASIGIDVGISSLYTFSTGEKIKVAFSREQDQKRIKKARKRLSKKEDGSKNREKARRKLARAHARVADRRRDCLHKLSTRLVHENQMIAIEDLDVRKMMQNRLFAQRIGEASWSAFRSMLEYKAKWRGRNVVAINRFYPSSRTCSTCGSLRGKIPINTREWTCHDCGSVHDRDINAAKNILAVGYTVTACGDGVRPPRTKRKAALVEAGTRSRED